MSEADNFKNRYLQQPITFLTEENLDKLENHCKKAIHYERGVEHQVVLELLERYKEFLAEQLIGLPVNKIKQDFEKPNFKAEITIFTDKDAIKQYFERKVEKE